MAAELAAVYDQVKQAQRLGSFQTTSVKMERETAGTAPTIWRRR